MGDKLDLAANASTSGSFPDAIGKLTSATKTLKALTSNPSPYVNTTVVGQAVSDHVETFNDTCHQLTEYVLENPGNVNQSFYLQVRRMMEEMLFLQMNLLDYDDPIMTARAEDLQAAIDCGSNLLGLMEGHLQGKKANCDDILLIFC